MDRYLYETVLNGDHVTFLKLIKEDESMTTQTTNESSNTVLHLAARFGHLELVLKILKLCPEMAVAENRDMETPLHEACREGEVEVMKVLIAANEKVVGKVNCRGESVLFVACERGKVHVVKHLIGFRRLLMHELDANICSIHVAAAAGHTEIIKEIVKVHPQFARKCTSKGYSPLHLACSRDHLDTTRELIRLDPDLLYLRDQKGLTPLHWASRKGRVRIIGESISQNLETVEMVTDRGETVLHLAARYNQFEGLRKIVETTNITKLVNIQDSDGNTVLHVATAGKLITMVTYLLAHGVDVNAINKEGLTALDVAVSDESNSTMIQIGSVLSEAGGKTCDQLPLTSKDIQEILPPKLIKHFSHTREMDSPTHHHHYEMEPQRISSRERLQNEGLRNVKNTTMVVAVLIATVTFSCGLNPPGGFIEETGKAKLGKQTPFKVFMMCNIIALFSSLWIVNILVNTIYFRKKSTEVLLLAIYKMIWVAITFMGLAYVAATWAILPRDSNSVLFMKGLMVIGVCSTPVVIVFGGWETIQQRLEWDRHEKKMKGDMHNSSFNSCV